tara:strand:- start:1193 stop:1669 length:477 start_codon:yes stop_codon:yes gene_type:complete
MASATHYYATHFTEPTQAILLRELRARLDPSNPRLPHKLGGTYCTQAFSDRLDHIVALFDKISIHNLAVLRTGDYDPREVSSWQDGPDMHLALQVYKEIGILNIGDIVTQDQCDRHVWNTVTEVICRQFVKPEIAQVRHFEPCWWFLRRAWRECRVLR